jgi:hypothetical protein
MSIRLPWGHKSRHCVYCGKVGPRIQLLGGYAHKYCMPTEVRKDHNRKVRASVPIAGEQKQRGT